MKGKTLKSFILATCIWTVAIMVLITYASRLISTMWNLIMVLMGLIIIWLLVNTLIIVHFLKKNSK
jgi:hypothetical protein